MEHKIYAIVGPHAAGKRLLIKKLEDFGLTDFVVTRKGQGYLVEAQ